MFGARLSGIFFSSVMIIAVIPAQLFLKHPRVKNSSAQNFIKGIHTPALDWTKNVGARTKPTAKKTFLVNDYGAAGDGKTSATLAIQKAIDDCAAKGGGIVSFNPGTYVTGAVFLKKAVHLRIDKEVTILGSQDFADYP